MKPYEMQNNEMERNTYWKFNDIWKRISYVHEKFSLNRDYKSEILGLK